MGYFAFLCFFVHSGMHAHILRILLLFGWLSSGLLFGQEEEESIPLSSTIQSQIPDFDLFGDQEPLKITLSFDHKVFIKGKFKDQYQPAEISIYADSQTVITQPIKLKARGNFRKKFCQFPPIRLNFKPANFEQPSLQQLDKLKLVTTCKYQEAFQQYLLKEYLVYKLYNLMTPYSFRVRLLIITYVDSKGKKKSFTRYGFVIEDIEVLAERNNCLELDVKSLPPSQTNREQLSLIGVFQYMIGNTDWYLGNMHNLKLIKLKNPIANRNYLVPYDFDYSGMVNTHYAIPADGLGIESVRERLYRGYCRREEEFQSIFQQFLEQKDAMYQLINDFPLLDKRSKWDMSSYLDSFFQDISSKGIVRRVFQSECLDRG